MNATSPDSDLAGVKRVKTISIAFAVLAVLMALSASNLIFAKVAAKRPPPGEHGGMLSSIQFLIDNVVTLAVFQIAVAAFILVCALRFHRYRRWARRALEGVAVFLGMALISGFALFIRAVGSVGPTVTGPGSEGAPRSVVIVFVSFASALILGVMVLIWASLRALRNPEVIRVVSQSGF